MEKEELQSQFIKWLDAKTNRQCNINNPFLLACLEEEVELKLNSMINGIPFHEFYSTEEIMNQIFNGWQSTAKSFLKLPKSNVSINFRNIAIPEIEDRSELLSQLSMLDLECNQE